MCEGSLEVVWSDGHTSRYTGEWLYQRAFAQEARELHRSSYKLSKVELYSQLYEVL